MLEHSRRRVERTKLILPIGVVVVVAYWFGEGFLHFAVFESGDFADVLFPANIHEICTRLFVVYIVLGFSVYSQVLVNRLSEAKDQFRILFDNAPDAMFITDSESGIITDVNPAASKLLLRPSDELVGLHQSKLYPAAKQDDSTRIFVAQIKDSKKGKKAQPIEQLVLRSDGVEVPVEIMTKTVDLGGRSILQGIFRDVTERKKVEEKLKQSEERFRLAMEVTNDALWDWDMQTNTVYRNPRHATMIGYKPGELSKAHDELEEWIHPDDRDYVFGLINEYIRGKEDPFEVEYRMLTKSGDCIWVLGRGKIVAYGKDGSPLRMIGTNIDITHRKRMEEALRQSEERYRSVVEDSPILVCSFLPDGDITFVNAAYCEYSGKTRQELVGQRFNLLIPEEDRRVVYESILSLKIDSPLMSHEHKVIAPDGQIRWQRWTIRGIFDDQGRAICFQSFGEDITEARRAREALRESEQKYRTLVESTDAAITAVDNDGVFLFMNKVGAERLGGKPEDFIGKTMWDVFPKDIADRQMGSVREVMRTKVGTNVASLTTIQGESRWYNTVLEPLREGKGELISVMVIARDIHEQKQAEEELEIYRAKMARTERLASLGTLSATAAHEITQPLTVLMLSLQNAIDELDGSGYAGAVNDKLKRCLAEASTIASIVGRFRSFAQRSSVQSVNDVSLKAVAERTVQLLSGVGRRMKTTLRLEGMNKLPSVRSDEKDLEQLFFALIDNAIRAGDKAKEQEIVVSSVVKDDHIVLRFSDNCGGIPSEDLGRIFEPFFTTKPADQGTGLGLCIVQDILTRIGGKIRVESTFGEGSTFIVALPILQDFRKLRS